MKLVLLTNSKNKKMPLASDQSQWNAFKCVSIDCAWNYVSQFEIALETEKANRTESNDVCFRFVAVNLYRISSVLFRFICCADTFHRKKL